MSEQKQYLEIGQIVAPQGIKGEVRVQPWCDSATFFEQFRVLYFEEGKTPVTVEKARGQKSVAVLKLQGVNDMESANLLRGKVLWCARSDVQLSERTYFVQDLIGLSVVDADDESIVYGKLSEVSATGANDVYHIENAGKVTLIPAIRQVVISTELENGVMRIRPLKGLFDDAD